MKRQKKNGWIILVGVLAIIAVILIAVGAYLITNQKDLHDMSYLERLELAEQYVEAGKYEEAVQVYWAAIDLNQTDEVCYLELGELYEKMGNSQSAASVYSLGFHRTQSEVLAQKLIVIQTTLKSDKEENNTTLNIVLLKEFSAVTYEVAQRKYGKPTVRTGAANQMEVSFEKLDSTFYFNNVSGKQPSDSAQPNEISMHNLAVLFGGMGDTLSYEELQAMALTGLRCQKDAGRNKTVVQFTAGNCGVIIESDQNGNILSRNAWNRIYPKHTAQQDVGGTRAITGRIINAATGDGVYGARVTFFMKGTRTEAGSCTSGTDGSYRCDNLEPGLYSAEITAEGFIEENMEAEVFSWDYDTEQDFTISPTLTADEIRLVLTWGAAPHDLDSYLLGTSSDGRDVLVSFYEQVASGPNGKIAELDVDNTEGYGPETTTIYDTKGSYRFIVADFNRTSTMAAMGAEVKIYVGNQAPITVSISSSPENQWLVCEIENGTVQVVNTAANESWSDNGGKIG